MYIKKLITWWLSFNLLVLSKFVLFNLLVLVLILTLLACIIFCFVLVSIAEVERLWLRFKQLGCSEKGELSDEALAQHSTYQDAFSRNVRSPNVLGHIM